MATLTQRIKAPAPRWFRRTKRAVSISTNGIILLLLGMGYADNSTIMLVLKIGISYGMQALEALLVDNSNDETEEVPA